MYGLNGAFVGTNSSLVAPVKIGAGAYIGSGSVITKDVPGDGLAAERSPQTNRAGAAARFREMKTRTSRQKREPSAAQLRMPVAPQRYSAPSRAVRVLVDQI